MRVEVYDMRDQVQADKEYHDLVNQISSKLGNPETSDSGSDCWTGGPNEKILTWNTVSGAKVIVKSNYCYHPSNLVYWYNLTIQPGTYENFEKMVDAVN